MSVQSAQSITTLFTTRVFATGVGTDADSLPTGTLYVNGVANAASVTVTRISTGLYKAQVTLPTLAVGDLVELVIAATVSAVADTAAIWGDTKDLIVDASGFVTSSSVTGNVVGNVGGNVVGTVASVVGAVGSVTGNVGGNVTGSVGSVVGAVGSVTGAVGSVTGNIGGNVTGSVGSVVAAVAITDNFKKNQALASFEFVMTDSTTHGPKTGLTVTAQRSLDGGALSACANAVSEVSNGIYSINLAAADTNANVATYRFSATGADDRLVTVIMQP